MRELKSGCHTVFIDQNGMEHDENNPRPMSDCIHFQSMLLRPDDFMFPSIIDCDLVKEGEIQFGFCNGQCKNYKHKTIKGLLESYTVKSDTILASDPERFKADCSEVIGSEVIGLGVINQTPYPVFEFILLKANEPTASHVVYTEESLRDVAADAPKFKPALDIFYDEKEKALKARVAILSWDNIDAKLKETKRPKWEGTTFDWTGFEKATKERWEGEEGGGACHCKLHNTYFTPVGEDGEPCWQCYDEFKIKIGG